MERQVTGESHVFNAIHVMEDLCLEDINYKNLKKFLTDDDI